MKGDQSEHTKNLKPLKVSDSVYKQKQRENHSRHWDKSGVVVEVKQHDQFLVKKNGSGVATLRNRRYLRKFQPFNTPLKLLTPSPAGPVTSQLTPPKPDVTTSPVVEDVTPPQPQTPTANLCQGKQMPVLTPQHLYQPPLPQKQTVTGEETIEKDQHSATPELSPRRYNRRDKSLPHTRLDLGRPASDTPKAPNTVTRSGRISKPGKRYPDC